jgi:hypothetical protein
MCIQLNVYCFSVVWLFSAITIPQTVTSARIVIVTSEKGLVLASLFS